LAALHQIPLAAVAPPSVTPFYAVPFMLPRPPFSQLHEYSNGTLRLIRTVQQFPAFTELLDTLRDGWRNDTLIHADIKWDNCLLVAPPGSTRKTRLKIIDWELAAPGDPCWDVGAIFNDYLTCWLQSIPITGEAPPEQFLQLARYPLDRMQPAIRAFWQAYWQGMDLDPATADAWAVRAVRYGAARLLQTVFEYSQFRMGLTGNMICMLQLSLNMLRQPETAARQLLGLRAATEAVA
jgi:aminoglycoside phosphotransferase (APT) family kinase protein